MNTCGKWLFLNHTPPLFPVGAAIQPAIARRALPYSRRGRFHTCPGRECKNKGGFGTWGGFGTRPYVSFDRQKNVHAQAPIRSVCCATGFLPAAAQCAVQVDLVVELQQLRLQQRLLGGEQLALRVQHVERTVDAIFLAQYRQLQAFKAGRNCSR